MRLNHSTNHATKRWNMTLEHDFPESRNWCFRWATNFTFINHRCWDPCPWALATKQGQLQCNQRYLVVQQYNQGHTRCALTNLAKFTCLTARPNPRTQLVGWFPDGKKSGLHCTDIQNISASCNSLFFFSYSITFSILVFPQLTTGTNQL